MKFTISSNNPQEVIDGRLWDYGTCLMVVNDVIVAGARAMSVQEVHVGGGMKHVVTVVTNMELGNKLPAWASSLGVDDDAGSRLTVNDLTMLTRIDSKDTVVTLYVQNTDQGLAPDDVGVHLLELDEMDSLLGRDSGGPGFAED